jgi:hypothetical protein
MNMLGIGPHVLCHFDFNQLRVTLSSGWKGQEVQKGCGDCNVCNDALLVNPVREI